MEAAESRADRAEARTAQAALTAETVAVRYDAPHECLAVLQAELDRGPARRAGGAAEQLRAALAPVSAGSGVGVIRFAGVQCLFRIGPHIELIGRRAQ